MARKFYFENLNDKQTTMEIFGDEFNHIANVMRKKVGDTINVIDGQGFDYECEIVEINKKSLKIEVKSKKICKNEAKTSVTVFQALVKGDKFELITQKLTELGVDKIIPFVSEYCQVKSNTTRLDRLDKISIEALKQCGRAKKVQIGKILGFDEMIQELNKYDLVLFAYENSNANFRSNLSKYTGKNVAIIIGSEGGFSEKENEILSKLSNVQTISLGCRILRAETASISLTSVVMYLLGEWNR